MAWARSSGSELLSVETETGCGPPGITSSAASLDLPAASAPLDRQAVPVERPFKDRLSSSRFRQAAVALALADEPSELHQSQARECASSLLELASGGAESTLTEILRPDPADTHGTWTVACYQIGDLSPSSLRDFSEAAPAVLHLAECETAAHVAAELIATNNAGVRWTALVRTGPNISYQPLGRASATAGSPEDLSAARHRWEDQLLSWASQPEETVEQPVSLPAPVTQPNVASVTVLGGSDPALGVAVGQVLETVRRIDQRLSLLEAEAVRQIEQRLAILEAEVGDRRIAALESPGPVAIRPTERRLLQVLGQWLVCRLAAWVERQGSRPPREAQRVQVVQAEARRPGWRGY